MYKYILTLFLISCAEQLENMPPAPPIEVKETYKTYSQPDWEIKIPSRYSVIEELEGSAEIGLKDETYESAILLTKEYFNGSVEDFSKKHLQELSGIKVTFSQKHNVGGTWGIKTEGFTNEGKIVVWQSMTVVNNRAYVLYCTGKSVSFQQSKVVCDEILDNFFITK